MQPMNNRQNGRRRGRNNNQRPQNGGGPSRGGGDSGNRIDSRARGNAAQLLEKYKNLAREAQLSGDRVQLEYYLQFADHYFRVLADAKARQEEQRASRADDRYDDRDTLDDAGPFNFGDEGERDDGLDDGRDMSRDGNRDSGRDSGRDRDRDAGRGRRERGDRGDRRVRPERVDEDSNGFTDSGDNRSADMADSDASDSRVGSAERPARREQVRPRRRPFGDSQREENDGGSAAIDVAVLPPAIGAPSVADAPTSSVDADTPPLRRRTVRARKPATENDAAADG